MAESERVSCYRHQGTYMYLKVIPVLAGARRKSGEDMRRERSAPRLHRHAHDWLPERVRKALRCRCVARVHRVVPFSDSRFAEVAFVGKAPGSYAMLLGGGYYGQRLNKIYRETVSEPEILAILKPMIKRYALERHEGERFGDFVIRAGYIAPTTEGKLWYDRMGGEGEHRESVV